MSITRANSFNFRHFLATHSDFEQTEGVDFSGTGSGVFHANLEEGQLKIDETEDKIEVTMGDSVIFVAERKTG